MPARLFSVVFLLPLLPSTLTLFTRTSHSFFKASLVMSESPLSTGMPSRWLTSPERPLASTLPVDNEDHRPSSPSDGRSTSNPRKRPAKDMIQYAEHVARKLRLKPDRWEDLKDFSQLTGPQQSIWIYGRMLETQEQVSTLVPAEAVYRIPATLDGKIDQLAFLTLIDPSIPSYVHKSAYEGPTLRVLASLKKHPSHGFTPEVRNDKAKHSVVQKRAELRLTHFRNLIKDMLLVSIGTARNPADVVLAGELRRQDCLNILELTQRIIALGSKVAPGIKISLELVGRISYLRWVFWNVYAKKGEKTPGYWEAVDKELDTLRKLKKNDAQEISKDFPMLSPSANRSLPTSSLTSTEPIVVDGNSDSDTEYCYTHRELRTLLEEVAASAVAKKMAELGPSRDITPPKNTVPSSSKSTLDFTAIINMLGKPSGPAASRVIDLDSDRQIDPYEIAIPNHIIKSLKASWSTYFPLSDLTPQNCQVGDRKKIHRKDKCLVFEDGAFVTKDVDPEERGVDTISETDYTPACYRLVNAVQTYFHPRNKAHELATRVRTMFDTIIARPDFHQNFNRYREYTTEVFKGWIRKPNVNLANWQHGLYNRICDANRDTKMAAAATSQNPPPRQNGSFREEHRGRNHQQQQNDANSEQGGPAERCMYCSIRGHCHSKCTEERGCWCQQTEGSRKWVPPIPNTRICWNYNGAPPLGTEPSKCIGITPKWRLARTREFRVRTEPGSPEDFVSWVGAEPRI
ncbi:hypothetical protein DFH06DRAFT_1139052 [Mycena polygramma]|nr:hypothetical protein DFH06DRAFT_1139052 [Mycena polygramma]